MTLITKFKSGKVTTIENVDDVDQDDGYLYVYMENGKQLRCSLTAVKYFIQRYATGAEYVLYPNKDCY